MEGSRYVMIGGGEGRWCANGWAATDTEISNLHVVHDTAQPIISYPLCKYMICLLFVYICAVALHCCYSYAVVAAVNQ